MSKALQALLESDGMQSNPFHRLSPWAIGYRNTAIKIVVNEEAALQTAHEVLAAAKNWLAFHNSVLWDVGEESGGRFGKKVHQGGRAPPAKWEFFKHTRRVCQLAEISSEWRISLSGDTNDLSYRVNLQDNSATTSKVRIAWSINCPN